MKVINREDFNNLDYENIEEIRVFIGGYMPENYNIYINFNSGDLIWSDDFIQENKRSLLLNNESITYIKKKLKEVNILNWNSDYVDKYIMDGRQWSLDIKINNKEKRI